MKLRALLPRISGLVFITLASTAAAQGPRSTGLGTIGTIDPNWQASFNGGLFGDAFILNRGGSSVTYQWIGPTASGSVQGGNADGVLDRFSYSVRTTFTGGAITSFQYQCAVDDAFLQVIFNGVSLGAGCDQYNFGSTRTIVGVLGGTNTLQFNYTGNGITDGIAVNITAVTQSTVPEPATFALFGTGALVVGVIARRRRHG